MRCLGGEVSEVKRDPALWATRCESGVRDPGIYRRMRLRVRVAGEYSPAPVSETSQCGVSVRRA